MNYHKIEKTSIANGTGIRTVLWVSGCRMACKNCHNPETWDINSGQLFDEKARNDLFDTLNKSYIQGITFSGGHPLENENLNTIYELIMEIKKTFPDKDIWLYTGYKWETILYPITTDDFNPERDRIIELRKQIVKMCDVVVDGKYIDELRDLTLKFKGSNNQRLIDVKKTLKEDKIILYEGDK